MGKILFKNYKNNTSIFVEKDEKIINSFNINFDGVEFESQKDLENYITESLSLYINIKEIENLENIVFSISINFQHLIK